LSLAALIDGGSRAVFRKSLPHGLMNDHGGVAMIVQRNRGRFSKGTRQVRDEVSHR
jgi:hypothetical protein